MYDGVDVNVTSNVTWFHLNHDIVSRRIYKLSFYGGHSITLPSCFTNATSSVGIAELGNGKRRQPIVALMATTLLSLYKTYPLALNSCLLEDNFYVTSVSATAYSV